MGVQSTNLPALHAQGALPLVIRVLAQVLDRLEGDAEQEAVATEALKLILNLTMHLGPLAKPPNPPPKPHEVPTHSIIMIMIMIIIIIIIIITNSGLLLLFNGNISNQ